MSEDNAVQSGPEFTQFPESTVPEGPVEGNLQVSKEEAAGFCLQISELYVMPHYADQLREGKAVIEAEQDPEKKFAEAKNLLATLVLNHHINLAVKALVEEKEREKNGNSASDSGNSDIVRVR